MHVHVLDSSYNEENILPDVYGIMACGQKSFKLVWRCHQLLFGFLANDHLSRVSRLSTNDINDETKPQVLHRCLGIYLTAEENPWKSELGDRLMKTVGPSLPQLGSPLPPRDYIRRRYKIKKFWLWSSFDCHLSSLLSRNIRLRTCFTAQYARAESWRTQDAALRRNLQIDRRVVESSFVSCAWCTLACRRGNVSE